MCKCYLGILKVTGENLRSRFIEYPCHSPQKIVHFNDKNNNFIVECQQTSKWSKLTTSAVGHHMTLGVMCREGCNMTSGDLLPKRHYLNKSDHIMFELRNIPQNNLPILSESENQEAHINTAQLLQIKGDLTTKSNKWARVFFGDKGWYWHNWWRLNEVCRLDNNRE